MKECGISAYFNYKIVYNNENNRFYSLKFLDHISGSQITDVVVNNYRVDTLFEKLEVDQVII